MPAVEIDSKALAKQIADSLAYGAKKQPGALLLNGGWGVGKTHFWLYEIAPLLKDERKVYVSLFGVTSAEELRSKLASALVLELAKGKSGWQQELIKEVPGLFGKGITKLVSFKFGQGAADLLKSLHIKVDPLKVFPHGTVVCLDDLERSKMDVEEMLGVINYLLEHKLGKVIIVANEDYLSGEKELDAEKRKVFKKFKEKVIWRTVGFHVPMDRVFDSFVDEFATTMKAKITDFKTLILGTLKAGNCKNLRTLQKIIRILDHILSIEGIQLDERNTRFLIALIDEDSTNGLDADFSIYSKNYSPILARNKTKDILDGRVDVEPVTRLAPVFVTHIQRDELSATKNPDRRARLLAVFREVTSEGVATESTVLGVSRLGESRLGGMVPTESMVWDVSRWDEAKWSNGNGLYEEIKCRLDKLNRGKPNNIQDALIAETAMLNGFVLVTHDADLTSVITELGGAASSLPAAIAQFA